MTHCNTANVKNLEMFCHLWFITVRGGCKIHVFEDSVLGKVLRCKTDEVWIQFRLLHSKELCDI
jgi:hypothetical protein